MKNVMKILVAVLTMVSIDAVLDAAPKRMTDAERRHQELVGQIGTLANALTRLAPPVVPPAAAPVAVAHAPVVNNPGAAVLIEAMVKRFGWRLATCVSGHASLSMLNRLIGCPFDWFNNTKIFGVSDKRLCGWHQAEVVLIFTILASVVTVYCGYNGFSCVKRFVDRMFA